MDEAGLEIERCWRSAEYGSYGGYPFVDKWIGLSLLKYMYQANLRQGNERGAYLLRSGRITQGRQAGSTGMVEDLNHLVIADGWRL